MILSPIISSIGCATRRFVADALREALEDATLEPAGVGQLVDFVDFSLKISRLDGPTFCSKTATPKPSSLLSGNMCGRARRLRRSSAARILGEARHKADGGLDVLKWGRPQNDGPALRALAVMRFLALDVFPERAAEAAADALAHRSRLYAFALARALRRSLGGNARFPLPHAARPAGGPCKWRNSLGCASRRWARRGLRRSGACVCSPSLIPTSIRKTASIADGWAEAGANAPPPRPLDIAVILAAVHAGRLSGTHSVGRPKNARHALCARASVRCALYRSIAAASGSMRAGARALRERQLFQQRRLLLLDARCRAILFSARASRGRGQVDLGNARKPRVARRAVAEACRRRLRRARSRKNCAMRSWPRRRCIAATCISRPCAAWPPASRELAEQFSQQDGQPTSADNLTWSYACFVTALAGATARRGRCDPRRGRR